MSETTQPPPEPEGEPFLHYNLSAQAHYARAVELLGRFDGQRDVAALFYAALELRFGIEARLHAYVDAALKARGLPTENSDYVASKLLKRLTKVEPHAQVGSIFTITEENVANPQSTPFFFTPVTRELAAAHGRLGELLHSKFFRNNPYWYLNRRPASIRDGRTLLQYRDFLNDVAQELESAIRGSLLTHPVFTRLVDEVVGEPDEVAP